MKIQNYSILSQLSESKDKKNGNKVNGKQNYRCKSCNRQFIGDHALHYKGCHSGLIQKVLLMLVRGLGIRDIAEIEKISIGKVLSVLVNSNRIISPKQTHYSHLEVDEFWTYVGKKSNKVWLLYAYYRESGEIVSYVWGKRNLKTARKLRKKLSDMGITFDSICTDEWQSFISAFSTDNHTVGKAHTVGIEGNNCRLRRRIRRTFKKLVVFLKSYTII